MMQKSLGLPLIATASLCLFATSIGIGGCGDSEGTTTTQGTAGDGGTGATGATGGTGGTGGSGAGGTGGGGQVNTGTDDCPGDPYSLSHMDVLNLHGTTMGAGDDHTSACPSTGPENVYALTFDAAGTAIFTYTGLDGQNPSFYTRLDCTDDGTLDWCRDFGMTERQIARHVDAETYFLFLDSNNDTSGEYDLTIDFQAARCGDNVINPTTNPVELCDDGNMVSNDGCSATCQPELGANEDCADALGVQIQLGTVVFSDTTTGYVHDHTYNEATCGIGGTPPGPIDDNGGGSDRVYRLEPQVGGTMTLKLGFNLDGVTPICAPPFNQPGCWDRVLHVRHTAGLSGTAVCQDTDDVTNANPALWIPPTNQIACDAFGLDPDYTQTVTFPVTANDSYYVFIDAFYQGATAVGLYNLHVTLQ